MTKILCVDDEPVNLELLEALLVPAGYEVLPAASGEKAGLDRRQAFLGRSFARKIPIWSIGRHDAGPVRL